jgi:CDP-6-deoxy-D-xylo-4-hexulose-3-dehydrase
VTGATGFIGSHLTRRLVAEGARVSAFMRATSDRRSLADALDRVSVHEVDIGDADGVSAAMARIRPEIVFHLAAIGMSEPFISPKVAMRVNVHGTLHLLEAAHQLGVRRFVHSGTAYEYGDAARSDPLAKEGLDPINIYAASKAAAWAFVRMYARTYGLPAVTMRLFAVYGPGQPPKTLVPSAVCAALEGRDFPMTPGEQMRDFVFVSDVVEGYLRAATAPGVEGVSIDLGAGQAWTIGEVVTRLFELAGSQGKPLVGALPYRPGETMKQVADTRAARELLNWQATTSLEDGLRQTVEWYRQSPGVVTFAAPVTRHPSPATLQSLREDIFDKVAEYYRARHADRTFVPGQTRVHYAGRMFDERELINAVDAALDFQLTHGRFGPEFERKLVEFLGVREVIPVNSGSSANLIAVATLCAQQLKNRLRPGDEVITPAMTFPTTLAPLVQNQLVPVLVDCQLGSYNIDVDQLEATYSPRVRALFIPHTLGNPVEMDKVMAFAQAHDLFVIEDTCDALGSKYAGQFVGTFGHLGTLSFYPAHHITTGEGGAVFTNSHRLARLARVLRDWGRDCFCGYDNPRNGKCGRRFEREIPGMPGTYDHRYFFTEIGYNLKLTEFQAAIGVAQMGKLPDFIARRKRHFRLIYDALKRFEEFLILPQWSARADPSWFAFPLCVRDGAPFGRKELTTFLESRNIETRYLFAGNILHQPGYQNIQARVVGNLANSDVVMRSAFFVGVYPGLDEARITYMLEQFQEFFASL